MSITTFINCSYFCDFLLAIDINRQKIYYLSNNGLCTFTFFNKTMFEASIEAMIYTFVFVFAIVIKAYFGKGIKYNYEASIIFTNCVFSLFNFTICKIKILFA